MDEYRGSVGIKNLVINNLEVVHKITLQDIVETRRLFRRIMFRMEYLHEVIC
jgi:hypothetical protein